MFLNMFIFLSVSSTQFSWLGWTDGLPIRDSSHILAVVSAPCSSLTTVSGILLFVIFSKVLLSTFLTYLLEVPGRSSYALKMNCPKLLKKWAIHLYIFKKAYDFCRLKCTRFNHEALVYNYRANLVSFLGMYPRLRSNDIRTSVTDDTWICLCWRYFCVNSGLLFSAFFFPCFCLVGTIM